MAEVRGRLKIYLGMSAGVGKTYAMLKDAREEVARGIDVVVGYVEPHGRKETEDLVKDLESISPRMVTYRGIEMRELDLESVLKRKPQTVLVDELAHSNAPGLLHAKRWLDVEMLLDAGINVYTTLNIQHIESAVEQVSALSGITIHETVPDSILKRADAIEVVDIPPEELIQRLKAGKIYDESKIQSALDNFFREGNLLALREVLLRKAAEKIDSDVVKFRQSRAVKNVWGTSDRMLVAIGPNRFARRLIQKAARIATSRKSALSVVYVQTPHLGALSPEAQDLLDEALSLAQVLGATVERRYGADIVGEILEVAVSLNASLIMVGKPLKGRLTNILTGALADNLISRSENLDILLVKGEEDEATSRPLLPKIKRPRIYNIFLAMLTVIAMTGLGLAVDAYTENSTIALLYILGAVVISRFSGRTEAVLASLVSILAFNFTFIEPRYTFSVQNPEDIVTFFVMVVVSLAISDLVTRVRLQNLLMSERERVALLLYESGKILNSCTSLDAIVLATHSALLRLPVGECGILLGESGRLHSAAASQSMFELESQEIAVAKYVFDKRRAAGIMTDTLPGASALYLPIQTDRAIYGVCGFQFDNENSVRELRPTCELILQQAALCMERISLEAETLKSNLKVETEAIRSVVLSAVSHDFRTPLTVIEGAAEQIAGGITEAARINELAALIREHSQRLSRMVNNTLSLTRLESDTLILRREWESLEELVGQAIEKLRPQLGSRRISVQSPDDLPLIQVDAVLLDQLITNVIENSIFHAPYATELETKIEMTSSELMLTISDNGPGLQAMSPEKFGIQGDTSRHVGIGLGLRLCEVIARLHGGRFTFGNRQGGSGTSAIVVFPRTSGA